MKSGTNVSGPNSGRQGSWSVASGVGYVDFVIDELLLQPATYEVSTAIIDRGHTFDFADREFGLRVRGRGYQEPGLTRMPGLWRRTSRGAPDRHRAHFLRRRTVSAER